MKKWLLVWLVVSRLYAGEIVDKWRDNPATQVYTLSQVPAPDSIPQVTVNGIVFDEGRDYQIIPVSVAVGSNIVVVTVYVVIIRGDWNTFDTPTVMIRYKTETR